MRFQESSPIPLYYQVKEWLKERIERAELQPNQLLPPEPELARQLGLSRNTVRRAILELTQEGLLHRKQGKGTFVSPPKLVQELNQLYTFSRVMSEKGHAVRDKIISFAEVEPRPSVRHSLQLPTGTTFEIKRLRYVDDEPVLIETSYIPVELCPSFSEEELRNSTLYGALAAHGIELVRADEFLEPVITDDYESGLLQVPRRFPALLDQRVAYDKTGRAAELSKAILRGDRCRYYISLSFRLPDITGGPGNTATDK